MPPHRIARRAALLAVLLAACAHDRQHATRPTPALDCPAAAPTPPPPAAPPVLALGGGHTCALLADGTVRCWGAGHWAMPTPIAGLTDVVSLSASGSHTCVAKRDGSVWCWNLDAENAGRGALGPFGVFTRVEGIEDAREVAAGPWHACALRADRTVACWASDRTGAFAAGTSQRCEGRPEQDRCQFMVTPIPRVEGAAAVVASRWHSCAIVAEGRVACWGSCGSHECGTGPGIDWFATRRGGVLVPGVVGATQLALGEHFSCARLADGTMRCWGLMRSMSDLQKVLPPAGVRRIAAAGRRLCFALASGAGACIDLGIAALRSEHPRDGSGLAPARISYPARDPCMLDEGVDVSPSSAFDATEIATGGMHACVTGADGGVRCWGDNSAGQVGDPWATFRAAPVPVMTAEGAPTPDAASATPEPGDKTQHTSELNYVPFDLRAALPEFDAPRPWQGVAQLFLVAVQAAAPRLRACLSAPGEVVHVRAVLDALPATRLFVGIHGDTAPARAQCVHDALASTQLPQPRESVTINLPLLR